MPFHRSGARYLSPPVPSRPASRALVSLLAAVAGALFAARPTGVGALDAAWSAAYTGGLAYLAVTAPRLHLLGAAGLTAVLAGTDTSLAAAVLAAVVAAWHATRRRPSPQLSGVTGGLLGLSLLTGNGPDARWLQALTTTGLTLFVVAVGLRGMSRRRRKRVLRWAAGAVGVLVLCALVGGVSALRSRAHVDDGIDAFRAAQQAATGADLRAAVRAFGDAERAFDEASTLLNGLGRFGRVVPGLAQQLEAATTAADAAEHAAEAARVAGSRIDLDAIGLRDGAVDLAAIRATEEPVGELVSAMVDTIDRLARVDRSFLLGPVSDGLDDALEEARNAGATVDRLHRAVQVAPELLGELRPARYLVLFTSPVEARGRIGFPGAYAVLGFDGGRVSFEPGGPATELRGQADGTPGFDQAAMVVPPRAQPYLGFGASREIRSVTIPAHGPASASLALQMAAQSGLGDLDGVVYADPEALALLVDLVGEVPVDEVDVTLTEATTADFLLRRQYLEFPELGPEQRERNELLTRISAEVGSRLPGLSLPRAQDVLDRFGPLVEGGHLAVALADRTHADGADLLADVGLDRGFPGPRPDDADVLLVTQVNVVGNKIDLFLRRQLTYDVHVDDDGRATGELVVELTNDVPSGSLPRYLVGSALEPEPPEGTNLSSTLVYSRFPLEHLTLDGETVLPMVFAEGGFHVYQVQVDLARGQTRTLQARFVGDALSDAPHEVVVEPGGLANPDVVTVSVRDDRFGDDVSATETVRRPLCASLRKGADRCS